MLKKYLSIRDDSYYKIIKIFSHYYYIKKNLKKQRKNITQYQYRQILTSWIHNGANKPLMDRLAFLETSMEAWYSEEKPIWLVYVCCLLETGKKQEALRVLEKYIYYFKLKNIPYFLPAANLAYEHGYTDKQIETCHKLFLKFEEDQKHHYLEEKLTKAKNIAIVGSAPNQLNKNTGKEIDSHDIVIRINNLHNGFEKDYGIKTDIWSIAISALWQKNFHKYNSTDENILRIVNGNYWQRVFHIHDYNPNIIKNSLTTFTPQNLKEQFANIVQPNFHIPTTGYITILWTYLILGSLKNVNFYGFSFLNENDNLNGHFFNTHETFPLDMSNERIIIDHNLSQEIINLRKLILNK